MYSYFFYGKGRNGLVVTSNITGKSYDTDRVLYINYIPQWSFYFQQGCDFEVLDILWDTSRNQKRPLCIVFKRSKRMKELYELWKAHGDADATQEI